MTTATRRVRPTTDQAQTGPAAPSNDETNATAHAKPLPDCETLLVGALLDGGATTATKVLRLVHDDDLADPHYRAILTAIRDAATAGESGVPAVSSRLMQSGVSGGPQGRLVNLRLLDAVTSGAIGLAAWDYAADVVECSQLRLLAGLCQVADAAATLATRDRTRYVLGYVRGIVTATTRVAELRQRSGGTD